MGANRTRFLANRRLQPLGHLSGSLTAIIPECTFSRLRTLASTAQGRIIPHPRTRTLGKLKIERLPDA
jgi:hypothetical protein